MDHKVIFNQGRVVPIQFRIFGSVVVFMIMAYALENLSEMPAVGICILVSMLLPAIWSSYYMLQIDPQNKIISEGYWIMSLKKMRHIPYDKIEKIFINKVTSGQRITSYAGNVSTLKTREYVAYMKLSKGDKIFLMSDRNEDSLNNRLKPIYKKLGLHQNL